MWVVLGMLFIFCILVPAWVILTDVPPLPPPAPTRAELFAEDARRTQSRIDDELYRGHIKMEEAAGVRRPGERRMTDDLGSWRDW